MSQQIILKEIQKPKEANLYKDIEWLGDSFGFLKGRDTEKIISKILQALLIEVAREGKTTSERLSQDLEIDTQRVNYHLRTLLEAGFIYREKRAIVLRHGSVKSAVEEIRKDANRILDNLSIIAEEIDKNLGLKNRLL